MNARWAAALIACGMVSLLGCHGSKKNPAAEPPKAERSVSVPILMYQHVRELDTNAATGGRDDTVSPKVFEQQMEWLHRHGFRCVTPLKIAEYLRGGPPLPAKPVVISFDDGWIEQYSAAMSVLKRDGLSATFFIYPAGIGTGSGDGISMTWTHVLSLQRQGMDIQCQSFDHPDLTQVKPGDLTQQVLASKAILESHLNHPVTVFAYPFGKYNDAVITAVRNAGYRGAVGVSEGVRQTSADLFSMHRIRISYDDSVDDFARRVEGHGAGRR